MYKKLINVVKENRTESFIHFILLILLFMVMESGLGSSLDTLEMNRLRMNFISLPIVFYFNAYFLIPRFLKQKKWFTYFVIFLLTSPILDLFRTLFTMLFLNDHDDNLPKGFGSIFFGNNSVSGGIFLGFAFSFAYRFTKDWLINLSFIEKLKTERSEMKLAFLKSQVDPHFLFNTLNSLYSIALEEKSNTTADGIAKLGTLMRYNLHDSQAETISLNKEIEYIEKYIDLQRLRTTEKNSINVHIQINDELLNTLMIAPMLLIPAIENAFKYGVSPTEETEISISITTKKSALMMEIENTIISNKNLEETSGVGIKNLEERLEMLYPSKHVFEYSEEKNIFTAHLTLELES